MKKKMIKPATSCKEYEKLIPAYINNTLDGDSTLELLSHIETCPSCKEELTIQFMVAQGLNKLEESGSFELNKELDSKIKASIHAVKIKNLSIVLFFAGIGIAFLAIVAIIVFILI